jgi:hypothetical protein
MGRVRGYALWVFLMAGQVIKPGHDSYAST